MELSEFIKTTLVEIYDGINKANVEVANRHGKTLGKDMSALFCIEPHRRDSKEGYIIFDVAVSATQESTTSGGGGIKVVVAALGGELSNATTQEQTSRIKFHVMPSGYVS